MPGTDGEMSWMVPNGHNEERADRMASEGNGRAFYSCHRTMCSYQPGRFALDIVSIEMCMRKNRDLFLCLGYKPLGAG